MFKPGDKVTYVTEHKRERGIIKSLSDEQHSFVVYHCSDDWKNYQNYTAARTKNEDLTEGWI